MDADDDWEAEPATSETSATSETYETYETSETLPTEPSEDELLEALDPAPGFGAQSDPEESPRARLAVYGVESLGDRELVALVLGGRRGASRADVVCSRYPGLRRLSRAWVHELASLRGIGEASASGLVAAFELGRRAELARAPLAQRLREPDEVVDFVRARIRGEQREHFMVLGLDARQRVRVLRTVAIGSLAQVDVHPREIFRPLIRAAVHACILVHNHPSGEPDPSDSDLELTRRMCEVGRIVGVPVLDHVIVTDDDYASLAALGWLDA